MKPLLLSLFFLILFTQPVWGSQPPHHDITLTLEPDRSFLQGVDRLTLSGSTRRLRLFLDPSLNVQSIRMEGKEITYDRFKDGSIKISFSSFNRKTFTLEIKYEGVFKKGEKALLNDEGAYFTEGARFYPALEGEISTFRVTVDGPADWEVVSQDKLEKEEKRTNGKTTVWSSEHPVPFLNLLAGAYRVTAREVGGVRLAAYFDDEEAPLADEYLDAAGRYLEADVKLLGPFPFHSFSIVEVPFPVGEAYPSFTLLGREVVKRRYTQNSTLGHELVHDWFGNSVFPEEEGNWSEALTAYLTDQDPAEREGGDQALRDRLHLLAEYSALVNDRNDYPLSAFREKETPVDQAIGYQKGAFVFLMLREMIGDEVFFDGLRQFAKEWRGKAAGWEEIRLSMERASGKALGWFFEQWVKRKGAPKLTGEATQSREKGPYRLLLRIDQDGQNGQEKPYRLQIPVEVVTSKGTERLEVNLETSQGQAAWTFSDRVEKVLLDPDYQVFQRLTPREMPPSMNVTLGDPEAFIVFAPKGGSRELLNAIREAWPHPVRNIETLTEKEIAEHSLFIVGWSPRFDPLLPKEIALGKSGGEVYGNKIDSKGALIVATFHHPMNPDKSVTLVVGSSKEAFPERFSYRLLHYGWESYVLFDRGKPVGQAVLIPPSSAREVTLK
jgi:aminopeptidase N